jgi:hypothetical protein
MAAANGPIPQSLAAGSDAPAAKKWSSRHVSKALQKATGGEFSAAKSGKSGGGSEALAAMAGLFGLPEAVEACVLLACFPIFFFFFFFFFFVHFFELNHRCKTRFSTLVLTP